MASKKKAAKKKTDKKKPAAKVSSKKAPAKKTPVAPNHEPAPEGFTAEQYPILSTIVRALEAEGVVEASPNKRGAPKRAIDINQIMAMLATYGPMIAALIASLRKHPEPVVVPTPVTPPLVPHPTDTPDVVPPVVSPPPVAARRIAGGKSHILGVEGWSPSRQHFSLGGGTVRNIATGDEPCGAGYRIHLDSTPWDQNRQPFFNPDVKTYAELFAQDPSQVVQDGFGKWTCGEGNNRINHFVTVDGVEYGPQGDMNPGTPFEGQEVVDLSSEYDDAACTPVLVVPQDIALSQEHRVSYRAEHVAPDGTVTKFEPSPTFRVKAWGF
jgi:hypothetical protein